MIDYRACCQPVDGGTSLRVRVSVRAQRTEVAGAHDGAVRVRLAAPPVEGKANKALVAWLAGALSVRRSDVALSSGERSRDKVLRVEGLSPDEVAGRLAASG